MSPSALAAMRDTLTHRGPDDAGTYLGPGVALGSRRLSIIDLSQRAHMPMSSADGRYHLAYNGEVYNFRQLRPALEARGARFQSDGDTEVVLQSLILDGAKALDRFNGMFAFAFYDSLARTLLLGRDRLGIKPLYYALHGERLLFGSEEKALFEAGHPKEFDPSVWEELLVFRFVAGERTPFKGVKRLLPGHCLRFADGKLETFRWWNLADKARQLRETQPADPQSWFRETFDDAIKLRRIADVPLGVMLSGGLDSSTVAGALATVAGNGVESFTVRFPEPGFDEGPIAQSVVDRWHLKHHEIRLPPKELFGLIRRASWLFDEPLVHGNDTQMLALSLYAKPKVTVLLSGEGADETLNGYVRYQPLRWPLALRGARYAVPAMRALERGRLEVRARKLRRFLSMPAIDDFVLFNACDLLPDDLLALGHQPSDPFAFRRERLAEAQQLYPAEPLRQAMYLDQHTFLCSLLDRNDRMTMGASIECRVPFLDFRLVEGEASLPTRRLMPGLTRKALLRRAMDDRLPEPVKKARKWGFGVPWGRYLREEPEFRSMVEALPELEPVRSGPLDRQRLRQAIDGYLSGDGRNEPLIKMLLMTAIWHDVQFNAAEPKRAAV